MLAIAERAPAQTSRGTDRSYSTADRPHADTPAHIYRPDRYKLGASANHCSIGGHVDSLDILFRERNASILANPYQSFSGIAISKIFSVHSLAPAFSPSLLPCSVHESKSPMTKLFPSAKILFGLMSQGITPSVCRCSIPFRISAKHENVCQSVELA